MGGRIPKRKRAKVCAAPCPTRAEVRCCLREGHEGKHSSDWVNGERYEWPCNAFDDWEPDDAAVERALDAWYETRRESVREAMRRAIIAAVRGE